MWHPYSADTLICPDTSASFRRIISSSFLTGLRFPCSPGWFIVVARKHLLISTNPRACYHKKRSNCNDMSPVQCVCTAHHIWNTSSLPAHVNPNSSKLVLDGCCWTFLAALCESRTTGPPLFNKLITEVNSCFLLYNYTQDCHPRTTVFKGSPLKQSIFFLNLMIKGYAWCEKTGLTQFLSALLSILAQLYFCWLGVLALVRMLSRCSHPIIGRHGSGGKVVALVGRGNVGVCCKTLSTR